MTGTRKHAAGRSAPEPAEPPAPPTVDRSIFRHGHCLEYAVAMRRRHGGAVRALVEEELDEDGGHVVAVAHAWHEVDDVTRDVDGILRLDTERIIGRVRPMVPTHRITPWLGSEKDLIDMVGLDEEVVDMASSILPESVGGRRKRAADDGPMAVHASMCLTLWGKLDGIPEPLRGIPGPDVRDEHGRTALLFAAANGSFGRFEWLLRRGDDPMAVDHHGAGILHHASRHAERFRTALDALGDRAAAALAMRDEAGWRPLEIAVDAYEEETDHGVIVAAFDAGAPMPAGRLDHRDHVDLIGETMHGLARKPHGVRKEPAMRRLRATIAVAILSGIEPSSHVFGNGPEFGNAAPFGDPRDAIRDVAIHDRDWLMAAITDDPAAPWVMTALAAMGGAQEAT